MGMPTTLKGRYRPQYPDKYKGDPANIWFRSSWERDVMQWLDRRTDVIWWMSEERAIWYRNPVTKKNARYFPDFIVCYEKDGVRYEEVIEVKPARQVKGPPVNPKRRTKNWMNEVKTYAVNLAKWKAAEGWCEDRGANFKILTEDNIPKWRKRK